MKGIIFPIVLVSLMSLVLAVCTDNNEFDIGDDLYVCSGECIYQNISNLSQFVDCDSTIKAYLSVTYPNRTFIIKHQEMTRNGNVFEYNLSNDIESSLISSGVYWGEIDVNGVKGFDDPIIFSIPISSISSVDSSSVSYGTSYDNPVRIDVDALKNKLQEEWLDEIKKNVFYIGFAIFLLVMVYANMKKRKVKKIAKEVEKILKFKRKKRKQRRKNKLK